MMDIFFYDGSVKRANSIKETGNNPTWIDVTDITKEEETILRESFSLHPLTSEDLYNSHVRIKVEEFDDYLFCVFYTIKKSKKIDIIEMDFVLGKKFLITNHKYSIESVENLKKDNKRIETSFKKGLDFLFHKILDAEVDNYLPVLEYIDDEIEKIENVIAKKIRRETISKILFLKRQIVKIKRVALPQRDKVSMIAKNDQLFISKKSVPYFRDIYDHTIRVSDSIDNYREAVGSTFDAYMSTVSNNMNEVMKVLSIIATIALPLTVISGIYGTNFINLPGSTNYYGFWVMIALMSLMMFGMLFYFWKKKWI